MLSKVLVFDPVPFKGGSKKVAQSVISMCPPDLSIVVVSNDHDSWKEQPVRLLPLFNCQWLTDQKSGLGYLIKHFIYSTILIYYGLLYGSFSKVVGISGPTVDYALYLAKFVLRWNVVQLIQGDIPQGKISRFGLHNADRVFYLFSTRHSIEKALGEKALFNKSKYQGFDNYIDATLISPVKASTQVGVLWAGSLLPWKRLNIFVKAHDRLSNIAINNEYFGTVCYIAPNGESLTPDNSSSNGLSYLNNPKDLDDIRSNSSIFVSTSIKEPFGLSILEAMIAGLAVIIPEDGAYWDKVLTDGVDCLKFSPDSVESLTKTIARLIDDVELRNKLGNNVKAISLKYTEQKNYQPILNSITNSQ